VAQRADEKEAAASYVAQAAVREALVGNMSLAKQQAQAAVALSTGRDVDAISAVALGLAGDAAQAAQLSAELASRFPEDTIVQFNYLPSIHAAIALQGGSARKAIEALVPAIPYELGSSSLTFTFALYPVYLRGEAHVAAQQGSAAAAEFQKILDHPGVVVNEPIGALAHLGLGRAYALEVQSAKARMRMPLARKPAPRTMISSRSGRTPTRTLPSCSPQDPNTPSCYNPCANPLAFQLYSVRSGCRV
jgi:eukaryotic-like serine/threonine-protein kinase